MNSYFSKIFIYLIPNSETKHINLSEPSNSFLVVSNKYKCCSIKNIKKNKLGFKKNDILLSVNDKNFQNLSFRDAIKYLSEIKYPITFYCCSNSSYQKTLKKYKYWIDKTNLHIELKNYFEHKIKVKNVLYLQQIIRRFLRNRKWFNLYNSIVEKEKNKSKKILNKKEEDFKKKLEHTNAIYEKEKKFSNIHWELYSECKLRCKFLESKQKINIVENKKLKNEKKKLLNKNNKLDKTIQFLKHDIKHINTIYNTLKESHVQLKKVNNLESEYSKTMKKNLNVTIDNYSKVINDKDTKISNLINKNINLPQITLKKHYHSLINTRGVYVFKNCKIGKPHIILLTYNSNNNTLIWRTPHSNKKSKCMKNPKLVPSVNNPWKENSLTFINDNRELYIECDNKNTKEILYSLFTDLLTN